MPGRGPRLLAFYLPQFHPIPENDAWWGQGFTEWTNVTRTRPRFRGHHQPRLPTDLGYYDLRLPEVREAQASLARDHGIDGFVYYHYWFDGRRLLNRPLDEVRASGRPDFPFAVCWANESWSRNWDGRERDVLVEQKYSAADDARHIEHLLDTMEDPRYITVDGSHLLLVYRVSRLPDPRRTSDVWRTAAARRGMRLHLCTIESFAEVLDPRSIGFDAAVEFLPQRDVLGPRVGIDGPAGLARKIGHRSSVYRTNNITLYSDMVARAQQKPLPDHPWYRCVTPSWDNSARRAVGARVLHGATPELYGAWLRSTLQATSEPLVFVNAWNEWAEGAYLEPDDRWGRQYLEQTLRAVHSSAGTR